MFVLPSHLFHELQSRLYCLGPIRIIPMTGLGRFGYLVSGSPHDNGLVKILVFKDAIQKPVI